MALEKRGRNRYADTPKRWSVTLPSSVANAVEEALQDPLRPGTVLYGGRNKLLTNLLREWLAKRPVLPTLDLDELDKEI